MRRASLALAATLLAGCGVDAAPRAAPAGESILAITTPPDGSSTVLGRFDADTLEPREGRFDLGEYHEAWAFSPDHRTLALGTFARTGVRLIDPVSLRPERDVPMPIAAIGVGWVSAERVAVLLQSGGVVLMDSRSGRILRRWPLQYQLACQGRRQAQTPHGVIFVVAARNGGTLRLLRIGASGRLDTVTLRRARSPSSRRACGVAALAVDPAGNRAFVGGSHGPAAIVDLRSLRASYRAERGLAGPCRQRVRNCTARRSAVWPAPDTLAVAGIERGERALGLASFDATTWSSRFVDRSAGHVAAMPDGSLLAFGVGLRAVTPDGVIRWTALSGIPIRAAQATAHRVYVLDAAGEATYVLDVGSGRLLSKSAGRGRFDVLLT